MDGGVREHVSGRQAGMIKDCPSTMAALLKKKEYRTVVKKTARVKDLSMIMTMIRGLPR